MVTVQLERTEMSSVSHSCSRLLICLSSNWHPFIIWGISLSAVAPPSLIPLSILTAHLHLTFKCSSAHLFPHVWYFQWWCRIFNKITTAMIYEMRFFFLFQAEDKHWRHVLSKCVGNSSPVCHEPDSVPVHVYPICHNPALFIYLFFLLLLDVICSVSNVGLSPILCTWCYTPYFLHSHLMYA